jgi:predicted thioesterase
MIISIHPESDATTVGKDVFFEYTLNIVATPIMIRYVMSTGKKTILLDNPL